MRAWIALISVVVMLATAWALPAQTVQELVDPGTLTVCLPRNGGVVAGRRLAGGSGFDYRVSAEIADRLDLTLKVVWIENDLDEESDPIRETYALLSHGLCDAVPGHPRYESSVGAPEFDRASLPRWLGMPQEIDPDTGLMRDRLAGFVDVEPVSVSQGYMRAEIGLVYRDGQDEPEGLSNWGDGRLALQQGTLSGAIATLQVNPVDRARLVTMNPGAGFLWEFEASDIELAIVDIPAFDAHLKANPFSPLRLASWRHPLGMDIGIAVLSRNPDLLARIDSALSDILSEGILDTIGTEEGLTYAPPKHLDLAPKLSLSSLRSMK